MFKKFKKKIKVEELKKVMYVFIEFIEKKLYVKNYLRHRTCLVAG